LGLLLLFSLPRTATPGVSKTDQFSGFLEWAFVRGQRIESFSAETSVCQMAALDCQMALHCDSLLDSERQPGFCLLPRTSRPSVLKD